MLLASAAAGLLPAPAHAVTVEDLFTVELPVADQTTSLRLESFSEAFKQVIVKVSGSDEALHSPAFKRPIENSARYVKQFRYLNRSLPDDEELTRARLFLRIDFDQQLIEGLLREQNFPVWGRERPSTLLVISYDVNENIKLVSDDATPDLVEALDRAASIHAVPVLFPLMDLEDIALVNIGDIASREYENIDTMAKRYAPNALLVGQIVGRSGQGWQGDWEVRFAEQIFKWSFKASSKQDVIDQVIGIWRKFWRSNMRWKIIERRTVAVAQRLRAGGYRQADQGAAIPEVVECGRQRAGGDDQQGCRHLPPATA